MTGVSRRERERDSGEAVWLDSALLYDSAQLNRGAYSSRRQKRSKVERTLYGGAELSTMKVEDGLETSF